MPTYLWYKKSDFSCRRTDWPTIVTNEGIPWGPRGPTMRSGINVGFVNLAIDLFSPFHHLLMWIPSMKDVESRWFYRFFGPTALGEEYHNWHQKEIWSLFLPLKSSPPFWIQRNSMSSKWIPQLLYSNVGNHTFVSRCYEFMLHRIIIAVKNILRQNLFGCFSFS